MYQNKFSGTGSTSLIFKGLFQSNQISKWRNSGNRGIMISSSLALTLVLSAFIIIGSNPASAFPDGAPGEACTRHKPNHGGNAQPLSALPFIVSASSSTYKPGQSIAGE